MSSRRHLLEHVIISMVFLQDIAQLHSQDDLWLRLGMTVTLEDLQARTHELLELELIELRGELVESEEDGRSARIALGITPAGIAWGQREIERLDAASIPFRAVMIGIGLSVDAALRAR